MADEAARISLVLKAIRKVNQLITQADDAQQLLQGACKILCTDLTYAHAWIALFDSSDKAVQYAAYGFDDAVSDDFFKKLKTGWRPPCVEAVFSTKDLVRFRNPSKDCRKCPFRDRLNEPDLERAIVCLLQAGKPSGVLNVAWSKGMVPASSEEDLLREVAGDLAFALRKLEITAEKEQAVEELRKRERFVSALLQSASVGIAVTRKRIIQEVNNYFCELTGYSREELIGKDTRMLYPSESDYFYVGVEGYRQLAEQGKGLVETRGRRKDGSLVWVLMGAIALEPDNPAGPVLFTLLDITQRKQAEEALLASEARFKAFMDFMPTPAFIKDTQGRHLFVNKYLEETFNAHDWLNKLPEEIFGPKVAARLAEGDRQALEWGHVVRQESLRDATGRLRSFITHKFVFETVTHQRLIGGVAMDITDRKLAEDALRASEANYRALVEASGDIVFRFDAEGYLLYASPSLERYVEVPPGGVEGRRLREFMAPPKGMDWEQVLTRLLPPSVAGQVELELSTKEGDKLFEVRYFPEHLETSAPPSLVVVARDITERKLAEKALRESEASYRTLVEHLDEVVMRFDSDLRVAYAGKMIENYIGLDASRLKGKRLSELFDYPYISNWEDDLRTVFETGEPAQLEFDFDTLLGKRLFNVRLIPEFDPSGKAYSVLVVARDITEHRRVEQNYALLFEKLQDSFTVREAVFDDSGRMVDCIFWDANPATASMLKVPLEDLIGRRASELFEELEPAFFEHYERCLKTGKSVEFEVYRKPLKCYFHVMAFPIGANRFATLSRDVSEQKQRQESLLRLSTAIEQAEEAVVITDLDANIQYVNPAFERLTLYSREEVLGENPRILQSGKHDAAFYRELWDTLTSGATWHGHFINKRKDGTEYEEDAVISPIRDADGTITGYVATKRDVTNERQLARQIEQLRKLESIGLLAGGVAHDFNNLLMPILGYADLLKEGLHGDDPRQQLLDQIKQAAEQAKALTRQLLAFSRKQVLELTSVNLSELVKNFLPLLRRMVRENIEFETFLAEDLPLVNADVNQFEQVLLNLVVNAQDAMPDGGTITLETAVLELDESVQLRHRQMQPGSYVMLSVSDTGVGMDEETLEHIFEPFFTTKELGKGTGLGLATVYGIIKQHNGYIWAYSEKGRGSTFKIYLPQATHLIEQAQPSLQAESDQGRGERILVVEDNPLVRQIAVAALQSRGYEVFEAAGPDEALDLVEDKEPPLDLLLTDVVMPAMHGKALYYMLKERYPKLKVIYMSGYTENVIAHHGVLDNNVALLQKPFSVETLTHKLRQVLDG